MKVHFWSSRSFHFCSALHSQSLWLLLMVDSMPLWLQWVIYLAVMSVKDYLQLHEENRQKWKNWSVYIVRTSLLHHVIERLAKLLTPQFSDILLLWPFISSMYQSELWVIWYDPAELPRTSVDRALPSVMGTSMYHLKQLFFKDCLWFAYTESHNL